MNMKTVYKWIWAWDFEKEEDWLNEMAMAGWALCEVGFCRYTFEQCEPGEYIIRLEMRENDDSYVNLMRESGAEYVGRVIRWIYFRRKAEMGPFEIFSDIDSRIAHIDRISKLLGAVGLLNLGIGVINTVNVSRLGVINLLLGTVLMYGLGRMRGKVEELRKERRLHE